METSGDVELSESCEVAVICSSSSAEPRPSSGRIGSCDITRREDWRESFEVEAATDYSNPMEDLLAFEEFWIASSRAVFEASVNS